MNKASETPTRMHGIGRVLVAIYGIMALAATGRSFVQIARDFEQAPLAYSLSVFAAVVYILATVALICSRHQAWYLTAWVCVLIELIGVLFVGSASLIWPALFPDATVWSDFGMGYLFIPLVLPFLGIWWLIKHRARPVGVGA